MFSRIVKSPRVLLAATPKPTPRQFSTSICRGSNSDKSAFDAKEGSVGREFQADGKVGGKAQQVGGPFSKDGAIGKQFTEDGKVGGTMQETAEELNDKKSMFDKDGAVGSKFTKDGSIGQVGEKVGGPFKSDGAIGKHFNADGAVGGTVQKNLGDKKGM